MVYEHIDGNRYSVTYKYNTKQNNDRPGDRYFVDILFLINI